MARSGCGREIRVMARCLGGPRGLWCGRADALKTLGFADAALYRTCVGILMYVSGDRFDLHFTVKELARQVSHPMAKDLLLLKRCVRYVVGARSLVTLLPYQDDPPRVDAYSDSDWAGEETARSTSGGVLMYGAHVWESWALTQQCVALSSGEAEFYAVGVCAARGLTIKRALLEMGFNVGLRIHSDSAAARGMCNRRGVGKVRHLQTRLLWIQTALEEKEFDLVSIPTADNPADLGTKFVARDVLEKCLRRLGLVDLVSAGWPALQVSKNVVAALVMAATLAQGDAHGDEEAGDDFGVRVGFLVYASEVGIIQVLVLVVALVWGLAVLLRRRADARPAGRRSCGTQTEEHVVEAPEVRQAAQDTAARAVGTQSQVTYTRHRAKPRFQPLPETDQGIFMD